MPRSPGYSAPTLAEMRTVVARTLRDTDGVVFGTDTLNDFIIEGLSDLSGYRPVEAVEMFNYAPVNYGDVQVVTPLVLNYIWQIEARNDDDVTAASQALIVPYISRESDVQNGWDFFGGDVHFGRWTSGILDNWTALTQGQALTLVLYGYRDRNLPDPTQDTEVLDLEDSVDQLCLTRECRMLGFQLLSNDRALYQQWIAATNNTDVSPTQLNGMLGSAGNDVERQRKRSAVYRRTPVIGPTYP